MKSQSLENIINQGKGIIRKAVLPAMITIAGAIPAKATNAATLTIDIDPTVGLGSEEVTDLTQWRGKIYTLGNNQFGYRLFNDSNRDRLFNDSNRDWMIVTETG